MSSGEAGSDIEVVTPPPPPPAVVPPTPPPRESQDREIDAARARPADGRENEAAAAPPLSDTKETSSGQDDGQPHAASGSSLSPSPSGSSSPRHATRTTAHVCRHIDASEGALRRYAAGLKWGRRARRGEVTKQDDEYGDDEQYDSKRRRLLPYPSCSTCHVSLHRPYICLECARPACFLARVEHSTDCMRRHLHEAEHDIAFDIFDGTLYCSGCDDIIYDERFEALALSERARSAIDKRDPEGYKMRIAQKSTISDDIDDAISICKSSRGIYNLGATCFMNVILQSFLHNPLMRNYFLSDRHNSALCPARENCLACELDTLYIEFFSVHTRTVPFAPTNFLFCVYLARESTEISSGAGEHDAHELFIAALNGVHSALMSVGREHSSRTERIPMYPHGDQAHGYAASRSGTASNASDDGQDNGVAPAFRYTSDILCPCVVHRTFAGVLQSDVTCQRCSWTSSTHDPFLDLSLDIRNVRGRGMSIIDLDSDAKKKGKKHKDKDDKERRDRLMRDSSGLDDDQSLVECLRRYCAIEKLAQSDYSCTQCGVPSQAVKQLSICRLPPVLCIQLKRFEHNTTAGAKIETRVKFPLTLDMREYYTNSMREDLDVKMDPECYLYDLFSVVVHEGRLNTGHYYCYIKWRDGWYIANDDAMRPARLEDVLTCRAYQLCYRRRALQNVRAEA